MHVDEDLAAAPVAPLVLTVLSEGESHGYAIVQRVRELTAGEGQRSWSDAMVYPLFRRLRRLGYVTAEWRALPGGRRRRYYAITDDGRTVLARDRRRWTRTVRGADAPWRGRGQPASVVAVA